MLGDKQKEEHREQYDEEWNKREAELHDKNLFRQPDGSHHGECPLCFLPMPLDPKKYAFHSCCSKMICGGCCYAHGRSNGGDRCPFCREPAVNIEENTKRMMKRIETNDPAAMREMGTRLYHEGDYDKAIEYWTNAAALGDPEAHYQLSTMHAAGKGVEKDEEKQVYHLEKAAMGGDPDARHNLACYEGRNGNAGRAVKHFIIAAKIGHENAMKKLWELYSYGSITKENLEATLRAHKAAIDEMKSPEREAANNWKIRR
jgi:tetratricopeptide (TPR) repeat protein